MQEIAINKKEMIIVKVAIYARVSTEDQRVDNQLQICRAYCDRNQWTIYKEYSDIISGTKDNRPQFNELLKDMREMKFNAIMVTKLDRMGRSLQHLLSILDELNNKKVKFIASTQNIDTSTSMGTLQMHIMGAFAQFERSIISERTKEGLKNAKNVGKRGRDKQPRKRRGAVIKNVYKLKKETKMEVIVKKFKRNCKRCGIRFETPHHSGKICPNCRGGSKSI